MSVSEALKTRDKKKIKQYWPELRSSDIECIGGGGYARCYSIDGEATLKVFTVQGLKQLSEQFGLRRTRRKSMHRSIDHLIDRLREVGQGPEIIEEFCKENIMGYKHVKGCPLHKYVEWMDELEVEMREKALVLKGISDNIAQLQDKGYVHGDLKPENIILEGLIEGKEYEPYEYPCGDYEPKITFIDWDLCQKTSTREGVFCCDARGVSGSLEWTPAEYFSFGSYQPRSETETLGKLMYYVLCGKMIYESEGTLKDEEVLFFGDAMQQIYRELPEFEINQELPENIESSMKGMIKHCLLRSSARPHARQVSEYLKELADVVTMQY